MDAHFDYQEATSRNLGWLSDWEQRLLRTKRVAIAGMGGVGGVHLLTLARLGIGAFHIADLDAFEVANFNRQVGAKMSSVGRAKVEVMAEEAWDINPTAEIVTFDHGVDADNVDAFLDGVDLYVDGLDFFAIEARRLVFRRCRELGIPAVTAAPLGMGVAYLLFTPEGMGFEEYFGLEGRSETEQLIRIMMGLAPASPHGRYLVDDTRLDLGARRAPSTPMGCQLSAGVMGTEALKILLGRGPCKPAPWYHQFDAYEQRWVSKKLRGGALNPLQIFKNRVARTVLAGRSEGTAQVAPSVEGPDAPVVPVAHELRQILELARWAPSGDNAQPWRFEIRGPESVRIHLSIPENDVYDLKGDGTVLSGGFLLATMRASASRFRRDLQWCAHREPDGSRVIDVELPRSETAVRDERVDFVTVRSVDRRPFQLTPLTEGHRAALSAAAGDGVEVRWFSSVMDRARFVRLNAEATGIRLRIPEAYEIHKQILDFDRTRSPSGVPGNAVGLNPLLLRSMKWAMESPMRHRWMARVAGTAAPSLEMDVLPGMACGAHFMVALRNQPTGDWDTALLRAGEAIQRLWLEATRLGLVLQPGFGPIAFGRYGADGVRFSSMPGMQARAEGLARSVRSLWSGRDFDTLVFAGRIGTPKSRAHTSRSVRRSVDELLHPASVDWAELRASASEQRELAPVAPSPNVIYQVA